MRSVARKGKQEIKRKTVGSGLETTTNTPKQIKLRSKFKKEKK